MSILPNCGRDRNQKPLEVSDSPAYVLENGNTETLFFSWTRKHVFRDLRPYVCVEKSCQKPNVHYARRIEWINHMEQDHWRRWSCSFECSETFPTWNTFRAHVQSSHGHVIPVDGMRAWEATSLLRNFDIPEACPLCQDFQTKDTKRYSSHVGHHLELLALFSLPQSGENDESDDLNKEEVEEYVFNGNNEEIMYSDEDHIIWRPQAKSLREYTKPFDAAQSQALDFNLESEERLEGASPEQKAHEEENQKPENHDVMEPPELALQSNSSTQVNVITDRPDILQQINFDRSSPEPDMSRHLDAIRPSRPLTDIVADLQLDNLVAGHAPAVPIQTKGSNVDGQGLRWICVRYP